MIIDTFQLKIIAALTMLVDHIGFVFFPDVIAFRIIGRLAFPLFAWLSVVAYHRTRDLSAYFVRLVLLACISQPFYLLLFGWRFNIVFSLALSIVCFVLLDKFPKHNPYIIFFLAFLGSLLKFEGMPYTFFYSLSLFYFYRRNLFKFWLFLIFSMALHAMETSQIHYFSTLSLFLISPNPSFSRLRSRWFYAFYPLHILAIYLISLLFSYTPSA